MTKIITIANIKGGVGKTVSTAAIGDILAREMGKKVLLIDAALQNDLSRLFGLGFDNPAYRSKIKTFGDMCMAECIVAHRNSNNNYDISQYIYKGIMNSSCKKEEYNNLSIIFSSDISEIFLQKIGYGVTLTIKTILTRLRELDEFDYILIDTRYASSISHICETFINNSDFLLIPSRPSPFALLGADNLIKSLKHTDGVEGKFRNHRFQLLGIFFCNTSLKALTNTKNLVKKSEFFEENSVFNTFIPSCRDVLNSENLGIPITRSLGSKVSVQYITLVREMLSKIEKLEEGNEK